MSPDANNASTDPDCSGDEDDINNMPDTIKECTPVAKSESNASGSSDQQTPTNSSSKPNAKDPLRPRRKKARRACFACQRAHLTCGDERPCQRCIKRGLQDQCHDGVRKKAKYLHDAPAEALIPPGMGGYQHSYMNDTTAAPLSPASGLPMIDSTAAHPPSHYAPNQSPTMDMYTPGPSQTHMPPPTQAQNGTFGSSHVPLPHAFHSAAGQQPNDMATSVPESSQHIQQFSGGPLFDPSDPSLFNFDIASLNFGNQYGALEFGMLNHMSSTANDGGGGDMMNSMNQQVSSYNQPYTENPGLVFGHDAMMNADWQTHSRPDGNSAVLLHTPNNTPIVQNMDRQEGVNGFSNAYAIGAGPGSHPSASPATSVAGQDGPIVEGNSNSPAMFGTTGPQPILSGSSVYNRHQHSKAQAVQPPQPTGLEASQNPTPNNPRKRPFNTDSLYDSVTKPYGYTAGFHRLFNVIKQRFSTEKRLRIAKAVSAIRPSLITFSQNLTDRDLVFMEVSVQRKLHEYVDFINSYGTPTIITRRDGAIVAASKEFGILTGWSKSVLLGKDANMNVNTGGLAVGSTGASNISRTRLPSEEIEVGKQPAGATRQDLNAMQPVLLAEVMDQDSVVRFYEEYAKLAFGDPRGFGLQHGRLLKYKTKEDVAASEAANQAEKNSKRKRGASSKGDPVVKIESDGTIRGESGINRLGEKEGMVDVMCCWNVRRDVFEVPMLIVMNFLPII